MKGYYYYEIIGGHLFEIDPCMLFVKTRKGDIPLYRQLMMCYRKTILDYSLSKAAARYSMDHASVIHAVKVVDGLREVDKSFKIIYNSFMDLCAKEVASREKSIALTTEDYKGDPLSIKAAISGVVTRQLTLQYYLTMVDIDITISKEILTQIESCRKDLDALIQLFTSNSVLNVIDN
jgi:hypothetical protein